MTPLNSATVATDLEDHDNNTVLATQGYTIRHIETWQTLDGSETVCVWDTPQITEADLPY